MRGARAAGGVRTGNASGQAWACRSHEVITADARKAAQRRRSESGSRNGSTFEVPLAARRIESNPVAKRETQLHKILCRWAQRVFLARESSLPRQTGRGLRPLLPRHPRSDLCSRSRPPRFHRQGNRAQAGTKIGRIILHRNGTERGTRTFAPFGRPSPPAPDYLFPASNRREPRRCASSDFLSFRIMKFAGRRLESVSFLCRARSILLVLLLDSRVRRLRAQ